MQYEDNIIGAVLSVTNNAQDIELSPQHFSSRSHAKVWKMMQDGVYDIMEAAKFIPEHDLADIIKSCHVQSIQSSAKNIIKAYNVRKISQQFDIAMKKIENNVEVNEALEGITFEGSAQTAYSKIDEFSVDVYDEMANRGDEEDSSRFIKTGFTDFDLKVGGLERGTLVIIAARPSMGKTSLMMNMCLEIAKTKNVIINSIEMDSKSLCYRSMAALSNLNLMSLRVATEFPTEVWNKASKAAMEIGELNLFIDDNAEMSANAIASKATAFARRREIAVIAIDYVGLIKSDSHSEKRYEAIAAMSMVFKKLAKKLNCCVMLLSQLNREAEGIKPNPSHLRESGSLEQDADMIIFPYRNNKNKAPIEDALLCIGKNRNGAIGDIKVLFEAKSASFKNAR